MRAFGFGFLFDGGMVRNLLMPLSGHLSRILINKSSSPSFSIMQIDIDHETVGQVIHGELLEEIEWDTEVTSNIIISIMNISVNPTSLNILFTGDYLEECPRILDKESRLTLSVKDTISDLPNISKIDSIFRPLHPNQASTANEIEIPITALLDFKEASGAGTTPNWYTGFFSWKIEIPNWIRIR
jgi:hypothetical protein